MVANVIFQFLEVCLTVWSAALCSLYFRDALLPLLSSLDNQGGKHLRNVGQCVTDVFCNIIVPGVRKWGWIVSIVFIDTSPQLVPPTAAAVLVCLSYATQK
jgi:hypothetical protein